MLYELLGLRVCETFGPDGRLVWAHLRSERAELMLALAEEPVRGEELRIDDPDGYRLMVAQREEAAG